MGSKAEPTFIEVIIMQIERRGPVASMTMRPVHGGGEFMPDEFTISGIDRQIADQLDVGLRYALRIVRDGTKATPPAHAELDRSDASDAARLRWMLNGHGYFLEEEGLCGHGAEDADKARRLIDEMMAGGE